MEVGGSVQLMAVGVWEVQQWHQAIVMTLVLMQDNMECHWRVPSEKQHHLTYTFEKLL